MFVSPVCPSFWCQAVIAHIMDIFGEKDKNEQKAEFWSENWTICRFFLHFPQIRAQSSTQGAVKAVLLETSTQCQGSSQDVALRQGPVPVLGLFFFQ